MNRKGFAPILIFLVIAGFLVVGGIWYYETNKASTTSQPPAQQVNQQPQSNPTPSFSITTSSDPSVYIYTNAAYGISFPFSSEDGSWGNGYDLYPTEGYFTSPTGTIQLGGDITLDNVDNGQMNISVNPNIADASSCNKFSGVSTQEPKSLPYYPNTLTRTVNSIQYSETVELGESSMTMSPIYYLFHTFTHNFCYEIDIAIIQPSSLYDPSVAQPLSEKQIESVITQSLSSISYSSIVPKEQYPN